MKQNRLLFKMLAVAILLLMGVSAKATTTITVGATGSYPTIGGVGGAYASITDATGGYVIELQSDYSPAGETYPITLGAATNANSATNSITIRPAIGNSTTFTFTAATASIFKLSGATWVTIDGLNATNFVVSNTTASGTASQCVLIEADASNNTIKNITAISICQIVTSGAIAIIGAGTNGCAGNTITNCTIKNGSAKNTCGIYVSDAKSTNTTITYNNIENVAGIASNLGYGINITSAEGTTGTNTVSSNNIYWTSATALANVTCGIYTANARTKIESNYIGYATSAHTGTASLSGNKVYGIYVVASLAFPCQYNVIANINLTGAPVTLSAHAIILGAGVAGGGTFNANTMENITVTSTGACEFRILNNNATGATTKVFSNNIIRNCSAVGGTATGIAQIMGISNYQAAASSLTYSNNQVYGLSAGYGSSTAANVVRGFSSGFSGTSGTNIVIERNLIYNLSILSTTGTNSGVIYGIFLSASGPGVIVKNNMVSLGKDFTLDNAIYGIYQGGTIVATHVYKIYHNSVYIGGAAPASPIKSTYAFYCVATGTGATTNDLKNNIFANQRTVTGTSAFHYCIGFTTLNVLKTCDNNLYWGQAGSSPLGSAAAVDKANLAAWKDAVVTGSDAASVSGDPSFIAPTDATPDLRVSASSMAVDTKGANLASTVTDDYYGNARSGLTPNDIGAYAYISTNSSATYNYYRSASTGNWGTLATWESSYDNATWATATLAPTSSAVSVFIQNAHEVTMDASATAPALTVNAGGKLTLNSGQTLTAATLTINSDASTGAGTFVDNGTSTITTPKMQQDLTGAGGVTPNGRFWYVSSPLTNATCAAFDVQSASPVNKLWSFSEVGYGYTQITTNATALTPNFGYVARLGANKTVALSGTAFNNGNINIAVTRTGTSNAKRGFNLIGNPYPSYLDINAAFNNTGNTTGLEQSIWYRSYNSGTSVMAFDTYNAFSGEGISLGSGGAALTNYVPPMQAFWVRATTDDVSGNLALTNAMRSHQATGNKLRSASTKQEIRLQVSNGRGIDQALIGVYDQAGDLFEDYDSHKMFNNNDSIPEIYTFAGKDEVAINGLAPFGNSKQMALGFNTRIPGTFTIKALELLNLEEGTKVLLRDNVQGINQDLTVAPEYTFTSDVAATADRFTLTIQKAATALEKTVQTSFGVRSLNGGQLEISLDGAAKASVKVFDTIGRLVFAQDMNGQVSTLSKSFNNGVYLVKVSVNGLVSTKKVAINL